MATKKKAPEKEAEAVGAEPAAEPEPGTIRTGVDIPPAEREVLQQPIDDRMAALLEDHKRMGVRK